MATPVFEEFDPASDCDCPGCVHWRRALPHSPSGHHPAAHRAVILAAAAATAVVAGHPATAYAAPAHPGTPVRDEPDTPQGGKTPLHGPGSRPAGSLKTPETTRADIIRRAKTWVAAKVPYSMSRYWGDGYRQDCSGFVSMAWNLPGNEWTGSLDQYGVRIAKEDLQPGDILLFHNPSDPQQGSHVVIFGGWTDYTHTSYLAYEETRPYARRQATPYAYWSHADRYLAYRYKGLVGGGTAGPGSDKPGTAKPDGEAGTPYPGRAYFGPGANNKYVTRLGRMLVERGAGRYYTSGPGPRWSDADRRATRAFQQAQGWRGQDADGLPGPLTWTLLVSGDGKDITSGAAGPPAPSSHGVPGYPGRAMFRPGATNAHVAQLGKQLVKKGFGRYYTSGPGPRWGESDRRAVEAFQRAQGWRGGAADGYPGPETWRRLFS
ncbi:peptidoglycan-binding protein [Streptomyces lincolnensis]|uniref:peptidoglycan-binding protein n=1 Tax=Streptomyces lincolnensis TaxID=1915 RepID=UPI001E28441F|nr:peptidoglycan-binding protein [Streptomyces lincolnensis]MCD7445702.1 peptidoglycan-binding protein [Streptomyces lincolnensis]